MAAPNILAATTATPHTVSITPADTSRNALVTAPASGSAQKINQIMVANIDGTTAYDATVELRLADGTTHRALASTISVPADATLILSDKSTAFYLEENRSIGIKSGTAGGLSVLCSWEEIS
jgi:hypothetical protein